MVGENRISAVRSSRDGHEYHETWAARKAMQLLWPDSDLTAITVEGPSPDDQKSVSSTATEIADLVLYYGGSDKFENASRVTYVQLKHSNTNGRFLTGKATETIQKFAQTYCDLIEEYGMQAVQEKLEFQLITNQPIGDSLMKARDALAKGTKPNRAVKRQVELIKEASGLTGKSLTSFMKKLEFIGQTGNLSETKRGLENLLVDWSAARDTMAMARLGKIKDLVREKAGQEGADRNSITRNDVLAALGIAVLEDLFPCDPALADVGKVLDRQQLPDAINRITSATSPLLIHATGGIGKTVFMEALAKEIANDHEVVFFDCFGGGAYRSPEDARHLPNRGLIHIANTLALRHSLCDPILPGNTDLQSLLKTFRRRLEQCVEAISQAAPGRKLILFIDAIDNAEIAANPHPEDCFPIKLLEILHTEPVVGVKLVVSCRTERKPETYAICDCDEFELRPFSKNETASFLRERLENVSLVEIDVAQARSRGNPRILKHLIETDRGLLEPSEIKKEIILDDLIRKRIDDALETTKERGYQKGDIHAFLAGLAVLPPPVPLEEYASACGIEVSAVNSFVSDMIPLLEQTNQGIMFRDEPTETLVRKRYATSPEALEQVATNLLARQNVSVYAAHTLPNLLYKLDDGDQLFSLAFDDRIPSSIASTIGERNVRYARLKAATLHAARKKNYNNLVRLLMEMSTIASVDQRGTEYILSHPDLVVAAQDADAMRRLFEARIGWPGTRHAGLTIANSLSGDFEEAARHARGEQEWIDHHSSSRSDDGIWDLEPEISDIAAIPFFLISQGRWKDAAQYLVGWPGWQAYEACAIIFNYSHLAGSIHSEYEQYLNSFVNEVPGIGALAAALSLKDFSRQKSKELTTKLSTRCKNATELDFSNMFYQKQPYNIQDGLRKAAVIASSLGLSKEAIAISLQVSHRRPSLEYFFNAFPNQNVFAYLFHVALRAAAEGRSIHETDVLPERLVRIYTQIGKKVTGKEFIEIAKEAGSEYIKGLSNQESQNVEQFIDHHLERLLTLTKALSSIFERRSRRLGKPFRRIVAIWEESFKNHDHLFSFLGLDIVLFVLWVQPELKPKTIKRFLTQAHKQDVGADTLIRIVAILAQREPCQVLAEKQAIKVRKMIETEDDVSHKASLFGSLARAILPASTSDAAVYFRNGLEQMDAVGPGDQDFTKELLSFASRLEGSELKECDFHTLSNICELNMSEEPEKFYWGAYGQGLSKVAGLRGLAKISRWDDRSKVALSSTLQPYLTGLLESGKINPKDALALNRLANPVEQFCASTKEFALALHQQAGLDKMMIEELVSQFWDNNPELRVGDTIETLISLTEKTLGRDADITNLLSHARTHFSKVTGIRNKRRNYHGRSNLMTQKEIKKQKRADRKSLMRIAKATDPTDEILLTDAIKKLNATENAYDLKSMFFKALRRNVPRRKRGQYIQNIAKQEALLFYWKLTELNDTKQAWADSSASLPDIFSSLAEPLINAHACDLVENGYLSGSSIEEISNLTDFPITDLVLELIAIFARPYRSISSSVWLSFATFVCGEVDEEQRHIALTHLLSSRMSRSADRVADGAWQKELYPNAEIDEVASGLIWRALGSPDAADRWRGMHCIRSFAKFGSWTIIDRLVENIHQCDAGPFRAKELPFFHMHARLWLLIALARIALEHPKEVSCYKKVLLSFVPKKGQPHVLMRHFASRALRACLKARTLNLSSKKTKRLRRADVSPRRRLNKEIRERGNFYSRRPESEPKPPFEFQLEYDFHKWDVDNLSKVFGQSCWKVADLISEMAHTIDTTTKSMNEPAERGSRHKYDHRAMTTRYHTHGQQIGYHALFLAAGRLLQTYPVMSDWQWYESDPWGEWLDRYILTRGDGLWLSDGTDRIPFDMVEFLLERKNKRLVITGDRKKILQLVGINSCVGEQVVIEGEWFSADGIKVDISSALVPTKGSTSLARDLIGEEPAMVWLPCFSEKEYEGEYLQSDKNGYEPWIVLPTGDTRLDRHDPYGTPSANLRPHLVKDYTTSTDLSKEDAFGRIWKDKHGHLSLHSQAWCRKDEYQENITRSGLRLFCTTSFLKNILKNHDCDLLILINLRHHQAAARNRDSKNTNTVAVVRITKSLGFKYFKGRINHSYISNF